MVKALIYYVKWKARELGELVRREA